MKSKLNYFHTNLFTLEFIVTHVLTNGGRVFAMAMQQLLLQNSYDSLQTKQFYIEENLLGFLTETFLPLPIS